ncbi:hypothetical protein QR680_005836 [Steinernema hermaphroditum]|uniref:Uncharacterized protein n=1 Tax=Steinernema hermaphroditum TaxID=289476 RepID=A0AA39HVV1_9BILA|nr:hypothetical protein QR680_005836 [Steinernema hermaphroditum]
MQQKATPNGDALNIRWSQAYDVLSNDNVELLWRHAKACLLHSRQATEVSKKESLLQQARQAIKFALDRSDEHFDVLKCAALVSSEIANLLKEPDRDELKKFKKYADRALDIDADDFDLLYLRARYHFTNPQFSWIRHFCSFCPATSFDLAIDDFQQAAVLRPGQYIEIHYYLALCFIAKDDVKSALQHLRIADDLAPVDSVHRRMKGEVRDLLVRFESKGF